MTRGKRGFITSRARKFVVDCMWTLFVAAYDWITSYNTASGAVSSWGILHGRLSGHEEKSPSCVGYNFDLVRRERRALRFQLTGQRMKSSLVHLISASTVVQYHRQKMEKIIAGLSILLSLWMLGQTEASAVHINLKDRSKLSDPTTREYYGQARTYIVHMDKTMTNTAMDTLETALSRYSQLLQSMKRQHSSGEPATLPLHVYSSVCHGFSAQLTPEEATILRQMIGVLGVYPDTMRSLHTTRTPEFLKLNTLNGLWPDGHYGEDVIVGVLDTGVWPERESFSDVGLGPVPARWKGSCQTSKDFNSSLCNKKLIGARYYVAGYENALNQTGQSFNETVDSRSPLDTEGHGTHTASTSAGSAVTSASLFGLANGTARGMAPKARIAVYKVCWAAGCFDSDILAAFDQAVADGVDVISLSVGGPAQEYFSDSIAIGAFGAVEKGVFVSCSAGNAGPYLQSVENVAPWLMTVAASTVDRAFPANVILGDGQVILGESLYVGSGLTENDTQLITGADATSGNVTESAKCFPGSLTPALVKGKIVVCQRGVNSRVEKGAVVLAAGGAGMILINTAVNGGVIADSHLLPATMVDSKDGSTILAYMNGTENPVGKFQFLGTEYNVKPAPVVAGFSSRGPNPVTPQVLKPDITGPGVDILAAWTGRVGPTGLDLDTRRVEFNIISGTSMSCPHVSGLAALLKSAHPDWSPAAIKSAMMTTASRLDNTQGVINDQFGMIEGTPFQFGSGHVQPEKALDPGLVYDMRTQDYVNFLCASKYSAENISIFTSGHNETVKCGSSVRIEDMNYPSFAAVFQESPSMLPISMNMTRTVTNVGNVNVTYSAQVVTPMNTYPLVSVQPNVLSFSARNEKKSFTVQVTTVNTPSATMSNVSVTTFAYLVWTDGTHDVQTPISITVYK